MIHSVAVRDLDNILAKGACVCYVLDCEVDCVESLISCATAPALLPLNRFLISSCGIDVITQSKSEGVSSPFPFCIQTLPAVTTNRSLAALLYAPSSIPRVDDPVS